MIAIFFKNNKADAASDAAIKVQGESAMQERMVRMLRQEAKLAWMPAPAHLADTSDVKKSFAARKVVSSVY